MDMERIASKITREAFGGNTPKQAVSDLISALEDEYSGGLYPEKKAQDALGKMLKDARQFKKDVIAFENRYGW